MFGKDCTWLWYVLNWKSVLVYRPIPDRIDVIAMRSFCALEALEYPHNLSLANRFALSSPPYSTLSFELGHVALVPWIDFWIRDIETIRDFAIRLSLAVELFGPVPTSSHELNEMFSENQETLLRLELSTWLGSSTSRCAVVQSNSYHGNHELNFLVIDTDAVWTESKVAFLKVYF